MGLGWAGSGGHYELTLRFARREAGSFGTCSIKIISSNAENGY